MSDVQSRAGIAKSMVRCYMLMARCCFKPTKQNRSAPCDVCIRRLEHFTAFCKWMAIAAVTSGANYANYKGDINVPYITKADFPNLHCCEISIDGPSVKCEIIYRPPGEYVESHKFSVGLLKQDFNEILNE